MLPYKLILRRVVSLDSDTTSGAQIQGIGRLARARRHNAIFQKQLNLRAAIAMNVVRIDSLEVEADKNPGAVRVREEFKV